ncbi:MAG: class I fructose-bisphosphate aldolase [Bacteroidota bacterium]|nr:class I fructose-bisphosphate aldolase [Bacteroidota bacterium]MXW31861.1 class I fructose-bisphosphate aldolase [Rhodothermaceae bacterium]MDE2644943.1 class I fructose-bisphosphate aldolase [Bacteroidota bacterium]MXZ17112.1 class I fructose-bisphosphate aldolase [Rhodothermaceae bacterium]MYE62212.1 class I fructose-bisphosphate aldolase [Rhodothermaceae bacterium]
MIDITAILGDEATDLLQHRCQHIPASLIRSPGPDFFETAGAISDRPPRVVRALERLYGVGRLAGTGYLSLLPVDHGVAHTAGMVFASNPVYLDPTAIVDLAEHGGSSGLVTTYGILGMVARAASRDLPLILKLNHDNQFTWPARYENILFSRVHEAAEMGCVAVAATVYFGGPNARRELRLVSGLFTEAHGLGMATILFSYLHPTALQKGGDDIIYSADLTAEANHQAATVQADLIKQKQPLWTGGADALGTDYGPVDMQTPKKLSSPHPIDLTRYQVLACYAGGIGLIHSGGAKGQNDLLQSVRAAVINKRGGGGGLLAGRKVFQQPLAEGVRLLHAIQDVYRNPDVTVA